MRKTDDYFSPSDYRATLGLWTLASARTFPCVAPAWLAPRR
jgi:hypothetical protein